MPTVIVGHHRAGEQPLASAIAGGTILARMRHAVPHPDLDRVVRWLTRR